MSGRRILLVEDERIPAFNLQQRLKALGYDVPTVVTSGTDALRVVAEQRPDLILKDIHIEGDIDGIETVRRIPPELMIPVIYLTAYSEEVTLQRAAATKAAGYLVKPFSNVSFTPLSRWPCSAMKRKRRCAGMKLNSGGAGRISGFFSRTAPCRCGSSRPPRSSSSMSTMRP